MSVWTTNEENRYQRRMIDPEYAAQCSQEAIELARERRRVAEAAGYVYKVRGTNTPR